MSSPETPLTPEMLRILQAVDRGGMGYLAGRYVIWGEERPDRRSREALTKRGFINYRVSFEKGTTWYVTDKGRAVLDLPPVPKEQRWKIRDIGGGWFSINDTGLDGKGHYEQLAKAFSRGRAEVVRDALEAAWPLEGGR